MGRLEDWKVRQAERHQARMQNSAPRPVGEVNYFKVFLAVLFAGWVLYALIQAGNA